MKRFFRIIRFLLVESHQYLRRVYYSLILFRIHSFKAMQPVYITGKGNVKIHSSVTFGVRNSPGYLNTYAYIEAREVDSEIIIKDNTAINNGFCIIANKAKIEIGYNCLIGDNVKIFGSDFHAITSGMKTKKNAIDRDVIIKDNVWICSNVIILKGVTIGINSIVGAGSVLTTSVPDNVLVAGNPAVVIRELD